MEHAPNFCSPFKISELWTLEPMCTTLKIIYFDKWHQKLVNKSLLALKRQDEASEDIIQAKF